MLPACSITAQPVREEGPAGNGSGAAAAFLDTDVTTKPKLVSVTQSNSSIMGD